MISRSLTRRRLLTSSIAGMSTLTVTASRVSAEASPEASPVANIDPWQEIGVGDITMASVLWERVLHCCSSWDMAAPWMTGIRRFWPPSRRSAK